MYDPQMLNRYSYVRNNPVRYTDPSGYFISGLINTVKSWLAPKTPTSSLSSKTIERSLTKNTAVNLPSQNNSKSPTTTDTTREQAIVRGIANFVVLDDISTLKNPNANAFQKGLAGVSIIGNIVPPAKLAKVAKLGKAAKYVDGAFDVSKRFDPNQQVVIDFAKEAQRKGITSEDAQTLLKWADEYGIDSRGPEIHSRRPYGKNPHIHIGPIDHIFIK